MFPHRSPNQFVLGENLLVAPVLSETDEFKRLYLRPNWYDLNGIASTLANNGSS